MRGSNHPTLARRARNALTVIGGTKCSDADITHLDIGIEYREGDSIEYRVSTERRYHSNPTQNNGTLLLPVAPVSLL
jgi:hypothetical protein